MAELEIFGELESQTGAADQTILINNYRLEQNYPNPFNPVTHIHYELEEPGNVLLEVYNLKGQKVDMLIDENHDAGKYSVTWDANKQGSGIYLLQYIAGSVKDVRKIILLK